MFVNTKFACVRASSSTITPVSGRCGSRRFSIRLAPEDRCHPQAGCSPTGEWRIPSRGQRLGRCGWLARPPRRAWRCAGRCGPAKPSCQAYPCRTRRVSAEASWRKPRLRHWRFRKSGSGRGAFEPMAAFCLGYLRGLAFAGKKLRHHRPVETAAGQRLRNPEI